MAEGVLTEEDIFMLLARDVFLHDVLFYHLGFFLVHPAGL